LGFDISLHRIFLWKIDQAENQALTPSMWTKERFNPLDKEQKANVRADIRQQNFEK